jgi:thioredoxin-dependent peroxiredoxin
MTAVTLKGNPINLSGNLPSTGTNMIDARLVQSDLQEVNLSSFSNYYLVLNIFPSIDTGTCAASVRAFNKHAASLPSTKVINVSRDLPFAQKRFCGAEGIENVLNLSDYRHHDFGRLYGLEMQDGPLMGLLARAVVVINPKGEIIYTELVNEIVNEPNYEAALKAIL